MSYGLNSSVSSLNQSYSKQQISKISLPTGLKSSLKLWSSPNDQSWLFGNSGLNLWLSQFKPYIIWTTVMCRRSLMCMITHIQIQIYGAQCHENFKESNQSALIKAIVLSQKVQNCINQISEKESLNFTCSLPLFQSEDFHNNLGSKIRIQGSIRSYSEQARQKIINRIKEQLSTIQLQGFTYKLALPQECIFVNDPKSAAHILRLGKLQFGGQYVKTPLPIQESEDFAYYLKTVPGAYFFFGWKDQQHQGTPHIPNYNFNERLIQMISKFWMRLLKDRMNVVDKE